MSKKIIAIWGNPDSGKTTLSIKLAMELSSRGKKVVLIHTDKMIPTLPTYMPSLQEPILSLGQILTAPLISQESILEGAMVIKDHKNLAILSYLQGENQRSYAQVTKDRVIDFMILLKHVADMVIMDCSSRLYEDMLSRLAVEMADQVMVLITPDLKAMVYFDSNLKLLKEGVEEGLIPVLSKVQPGMPKNLVANCFGGIQYQLPLSAAIIKESMEGDLMTESLTKEGLLYHQTVEKLLLELMGENDLSIKSARNNDPKSKEEKSSLKDESKTRHTRWFEPVKSFMVRSKNRKSIEADQASESDQVSADQLKTGEKVASKAYGHRDKKITRDIRNKQGKKQWQNILKSTKEVLGIGGDEE